MTDFWENKRLNQNLSFYMLAPFLEEAGRMLRAARILWHPWSRRRGEELDRIGVELRNHAHFLRERAFGWSQHVPALHVEHSYMHLGSIPHSWYFNRDETPKECPEAVPYLVSGALKLLFAVSPVYQKIAKSDWSTASQGESWFGHIETLMESPCLGTRPEITDEVLQHLLVKAALTECHGLAHTLAIAEDNFSRYEEKHTSKKPKRKPSGFTREQMAALAEEIGTSFENIEAVMTSEYSKWWDVSQLYANRVDATREVILDGLSLSPELTASLQSAWIIGSPSHGERTGPDCHSEYDRELVERCVRMFIGYFRLVIDQANAGTLFTPERVLLEQK